MQIGRRVAGIEQRIGRRKIRLCGAAPSRAFRMAVRVPPPPARSLHNRRCPACAHAALPPRTGSTGPPPVRAQDGGIRKRSTASPPTIHSPSARRKTPRPLVRGTGLATIIRRKQLIYARRKCMHPANPRRERKHIEQEFRIAKIGVQDHVRFRRGVPQLLRIVTDDETRFGREPVERLQMWGAGISGHQQREGQSSQVHRIACSRHSSPKIPTLGVEIRRRSHHEHVLTHRSDSGRETAHPRMRGMPEDGRHVGPLCASV